MPRYVKLPDIQSFRNRIDHCDKKNWNPHFILGVESSMEFVDYLPQYEFPEAEPVTRPDFDYGDSDGST